MCLPLKRSLFRRQRCLGGSKSYPEDAPPLGFLQRDANGLRISTAGVSLVWFVQYLRCLRCLLGLCSCVRVLYAKLLRECRKLRGGFCGRDMLKKVWSAVDAEPVPRERF